MRLGEGFPVRHPREDRKGGVCRSSPGGAGCAVSGTGQPWAPGFLACSGAGALFGRGGPVRSRCSGRSLRARPTVSGTVRSLIRH